MVSQKASVPTCWGENAEVPEEVVLFVNAQQGIIKGGKAEEGGRMVDE